MQRSEAYLACSGSPCLGFLRYQHVKENRLDGIVGPIGRVMQVLLDVWGTEDRLSVGAEDREEVQRPALVTAQHRKQRQWGYRTDSECSVPYERGHGAA